MVLRPLASFTLSICLAACSALAPRETAPVELLGLDCPAELTIGESGSFLAMVSPDATLPDSIRWDWGDGTTGAGRTASHRFRSYGTYTVTATAVSGSASDTETCVVTAITTGHAPYLFACNVSPVPASPGEPVTFSGQTNSDALGPITFSVDWGDGNGERSDALPMMHRYSEQGTYTATLTTRNPYGENSCEATVTIATPD